LHVSILQSFFALHLFLCEVETIGESSQKFGARYPEVELARSKYPGY
jgi:hypothetical protein